MAMLFALDFPLGPDLERAVRQCVDVQQAFCVLDQRLSLERRAQELLALGATHVVDHTGVTSLDGGTGVDDGIGLVILTSGSSGMPRAAELSWESLSASAEITQATLRGATTPVWYPCLPANHIGGLAVVLRAVLSDARLLWGDPRELANAPRRGATHVAVVRAQLFDHDLSGFDVVLLGGAHPPGDLAHNVISTWGMTETGSGVVYNARALRDVQICDVDGQICVKSPTLFRSYRETPRPRILGPDGDDEWFPTGDAGDVIDGVVRIRGRLRYVINTGGEKVWPDDLEAVIANVAGVRDVAVTSVADEKWGERIIALVITDNETLDDQIRDAAHEHVGPWAKPKEIRYVSNIPRTMNGKIRRDVLPSTR